MRGRRTTTTPAPTPGLALELSDLRHEYGTGEGVVRALRGLDLAVEQGSFTAVMGPSGSGKSTLLQVVAGLERPTAGRVVVGGDDLGGWSETRRTTWRRSRLGVVFQGFHLVPYLTAEQNVGLPVRLAGRTPDRDRVRSLLAAVGLDERRDHLPAQLSGGQQQRVAIARALLADPDLVLADEPTGALDTTSAREVLALLRRSSGQGRDASRSGRSVLMVTHDPVAAATADEVVFLVDGRVAGRVQEPTADAVASHLAHLDELVTSPVTSPATSPVTSPATVPAGVPA